jgi:hypothetical protein
MVLIYNLNGATVLEVIISHKAGITLYMHVSYVFSESEISELVASWPSNLYYSLQKVILALS